MVVRSDGEMMYSGRAKIERDTVAFTISGIPGEGTARTKFSGNLSGREIDIQAHVASKKRENKRTTNSIRFEDRKR